MSTMVPSVAARLNELAASVLGVLFMFLVIAIGVALVAVGGAGVARTRRHAH